MRQETYAAMMQLCHSMPEGRVPTAEQAMELGVSHDALLSARRQDLVRRMKILSGKQRRTAADIRARFEQGESIHDIARKAGFSPYLLARMMVEEVCGVQRQEVSHLIKQPDLLTNCRLREQVAECVMRDVDFSPDMDRVCRHVGRDYEQLLALKLRRLNLPFETEEMLRSQGMPKTPDVRLLVPCGITTRESTEHVVNWIDSKAMFGDRDTILTDVMPQVTSYLNRFGPGLVIFWFGFLEEVEGPEFSNDVVIMDHFPESLLLPTGASVSPSSPYLASSIGASAVSGEA